MEENAKRSRFLQYAMNIADLGYRVFTRDDSDVYYGWVVNEENGIGYFQLDDFGLGVCFSTLHRPTKEFVSGFGLDDRFEGHRKLTMKIVDRAFKHHPDWAHGRLCLIRKYTADEYLMEKKEKWGYNDIVELKPLCL